MRTSSENFQEEHVTFTLNRLIITDKEKCAEEIIKKCRENDFTSILFSYDVAKPNALYGTVYRSRRTQKTTWPHTEMQEMKRSCGKETEARQAERLPLYGLFRFNS